MLIILNHSSGTNINSTNNKVIIDILLLIALFIDMFSGLNLTLLCNVSMFFLELLLGNMCPVNIIFLIEAFGW